jgi:hypothetical protein
MPNDPRSTSLGAWIPRVSTKARPGRPPPRRRSPRADRGEHAAVSRRSRTRCPRSGRHGAARPPHRAHQRDGSNAW